MSLIYTNPKTWPQLRQVLQQISRCLSDFFGILIDEGVAAQAIDAGEVVYIPSAGNIDLADASAIATGRAVGVARENIASGASGEFVSNGKVTNTGWSLTPGATYFLSGTTPGAIVTAPDDTTEGTAVVQSVGFALSATELYVHIPPPMQY